MAAEWAAQLGKARRVRDDEAAQSADSVRERSTQAADLARERWPGIVAAIRGVVGAYNAGVEDEVLHVAEDPAVPGRPAIRIVSNTADGPFLSAGLEGTLICLRTRTADGQVSEVEHRLRPDRDDERTAAYLVQNWLERL